MPINVIHGARPGDNEIQRRMDSILAQDQRNRELEQQRQLQVAQMNSQAAQNNARLNFSYAAMNRENQEQQARLALAARAQELGAIQQQDYTALQALRVQQAQQEAQAAQSYAWGKEVVQNLDGQIGAITKAVTNTNLNPEGQRLYRDWAGKKAAIEKQRPNLNPQQYGKLQAQLLDEFNRLGLDNHEVKVPKPIERWKEEAVPLPDGSFVVPNPKGGWEHIKPDKPSASGTAGQGTAPSRQIDIPTYLSDPKNYDREYEAAQKRLQAKIDNSLTADQIGRAPEPKEVMEEMTRYLQDRNAHLASFGGAPAQQGQPNQPQQPQQQPATGTAADYNSNAPYAIFSEKLGKVLSPQELQQIIVEAKAKNLSHEEVGRQLGLRQVAAQQMASTDKMSEQGAMRVGIGGMRKVRESQIPPERVKIAEQQMSEIMDKYKTWDKVPDPIKTQMLLYMQALGYE